MPIKKNVRLSPLSTFKIGGRAEFFCRIKTSEELIKAIGWARKKTFPFRIFAGGSNVVFPDKKIRGLLIQFLGGKIFVNKNRFVVNAGVPLSHVVGKSIDLGLAGLETLSGIPGTIGGAIVGNAGAYGHSISGVVEKIEVFDPVTDKVFWLSNIESKFQYRNSVLKHKSYLLLRAVIKFKKGDPKKLKKTSREIIELRLKKYKPGLRCPGSFFKNVLARDVSKKSLAKIDKSKIIEGKIPAGYLLEAVGAKGMRVGDIEIANFHGNLFINKNHGTAGEVRKTAELLRRRVKNKFGIKLEEEIRYF